MEPGTYFLLLYGKASKFRVGSLGNVIFSDGFYVYVGSALGPGGLSRVTRHIRLSRERNKAPRWHIDYLLLDGRFTFLRAYCTLTSSRLECIYAQKLPLQPMIRFGCSDCSCISHLFFSKSDPDALIQEACKSSGIRTVIHIINTCPIR